MQMKICASPRNISCMFALLKRTDLVPFKCVNTTYRNGIFNVSISTKNTTSDSFGGRNGSVICLRSKDGKCPTLLYYINNLPVSYL